MFVLPPCICGPVTALRILVTISVFSAGFFFVTIHNTAIDCAHGSATHAACAVDILTGLITAIVSSGAAAGAMFVGLASPTPRSPLVCRVDGELVN